MLQGLNLSRGRVSVSYRLENTKDIQFPTGSFVRNIRKEKRDITMCSDEKNFYSPINSDLVFGHCGNKKRRRKITSASTILYEPDEKCGTMSSNKKWISSFERNCGTASVGE